MLRVTDFGIGAVAAQPVLEHSRSSSSLEGNLSSVLTGSYSPLYASPQQMRGDKPDPRDDVYALGVIWYQLLKGDLSSPGPDGPAVDGIAAGPRDERCGHRPAVLVLRRTRMIAPTMLQRLPATGPLDVLQRNRPLR